MTTIIGIDPGATGALAWIGPKHPKRVSIAVVDLPAITTTKSGKKRTKLNVLSLMDLFASLSDADHAFVELSSPRPTDRPTSAWANGHTAGTIETALAVSGIPITFVTAASWKRTFGLLRTDKEASRRRALELFPGQAQALRRKKDHNRAEALLIAEWGRRSLATGPKATTRVSAASR